MSGKVPTERIVRRGLCYLLAMRWSCALLAAMVVLGASGEALEQGSPAISSYRIGAGDVLRVEAYNHDEISGEFAVEANGDISYPLLGRVEVEGLSTAAVAERLEALLEKDYYVDVQLQVEVEEYRSKPVTVLGEVARPGTYYLKGRTSLHEILAEAGGIRSSAGAVIELRRIEQVDGIDTPMARYFQTAAVNSGADGRDTFLVPGDVVSVSVKQRYFITGEIASPGQYDLTPDMTLMQAISQAGGQGKFASQTVEVHRGHDDEQEKKIMTFDLSQIRKGKAADPTIEAGDVIIVRRRFF
jgi:polysaccharide export outer membrane protein